MTPTERPPTFSPGQLADAFEDLVAGRRADYRDDLVGRVRATPQRPAWTFIERWNPMTLITARPATATPLRGAWVLLLTGLVVAALVASLVIVGSALLRDERPDGLNVGLLVPTLELDRTWDATPIEGLSRPSGIDVGPDGNIYVVNAGADEIARVDARRRHRASLGRTRRRRRPVLLPARLADRDGDARRSGRSARRDRLRRGHGQRPRAGASMRTGRFMRSVGRVRARRREVHQPHRRRGRTRTGASSWSMTVRDDIQRFEPGRGLLGRRSASLAEPTAS